MVTPSAAVTRTVSTVVPTASATADDAAPLLAPAPLTVSVAAAALVVAVTLRLLTAFATAAV